MNINIDTLKSFEHNTSLGKILCTYFNTTTAENLVYAMSKDSYKIVKSWSERTEIEKYRLISMIYTSYNDEATFKVEHIFNSYLGYPECSLSFMPNKRFDYHKPIVFIFDWPINED